jgi:hypothetical protein
LTDNVVKPDGPILPVKPLEKRKDMESPAKLLAFSRSQIPETL